MIKNETEVESVAHCSLQVQTVVYGLKAEAIVRTVAGLARSYELAKESGILTRMKIRIGDTSSERCLDEKTFSAMRNKYSGHAEIDYVFFDANVGSARGHNALADGCDTDYIMILNPDVVIAPRTLERMLQPFVSDKVGMTEARQLPIEHPKDYDKITGQTGWATTACAVTPRTLFERIDGFDADSFFLYCDDVDYSWKVREAGKNIIYLPQATVFHDKRLSTTGGWQPSSAEIHYSAQAALLMMHKWSFHQQLEALLKLFDEGSKEQKAAVQNFMDRRAAGTLPEPRDPMHEVGYLDEHNFYTKHRYLL